MKKQLTLSVAFLTASLLASSVLASEATQSTDHLKKGKHHHHHHAAAVAAPVEAVAAPEAKSMYFAAEASYNFTNYKPKFTNSGTASKKYKNSGSFGVGFGTTINENFKADLMLSFFPKSSLNVTDNAGDKLNINVTTTKLMLNGTYDFGDMMGAGVHPYVAAGVGTSYNKISTTVNGAATNKKPWNFAYQVGAGAAYKLNGGQVISLGYRFADNGTGAKVANVSKKNLQSHEIVLGVQVPF